MSNPAEDLAYYWRLFEPEWKPLRDQWNDQTANRFTDWVWEPLERGTTAWLQAANELLITLYDAQEQAAKRSGYH